MPSRSKSQQRLFGMVHACQKTGKCASPEVEKLAGEIGKKDAKDFAKTKHKGLPNKVKKKRRKKKAENKGAFMSFAEWVERRFNKTEQKPVSESLRAHSTRDPLARMETKGSPVDANGRTCSWCGQSRSDGKLYQYSVEHDGGRKSDLKGLFCCKGCFKAYHA